MGLKLNNLFDRGMGTHGEDGDKSLKNDNVPVIAGHYLVAEIRYIFREQCFEVCSFYTVFAAIVPLNFNRL